MGTRTVSVLSLLALSLHATAALAAEPSVSQQPYGDREETIDLGHTYEPEAVYVTRLAARVADAKVTGSFQIHNTEDTLVTGLQYRIELRGIGDEDGLPYMHDVVRASIALAPNETKTLLLASALPNVPAGRYDLRVQLLTAKGRSLGWADTPVVVTDEEASATFVHLYPGTIGIEAYGDELLPPLSGPNVDPSTKLTLRGMAVNKGDADVRVKPIVEIFDFNAARVGIASYEFAALRVGAGESVPLDMPIASDAAPGVYMAHVTLRDADTHETISTIAQYRYVVKGEDADIVALRIENMGTKGGDWAYGTVDLAGAADALTSTTATLRVQLKDDDGVLGSVEVPGIELTDAILTAKIRIPLDRDLVGAPTVEASLLSATNATFDHAVYAGTLTPAQLEQLTQDKAVSNWVAWHGMARLSLFLFVMAAVGYGLFSLVARMRGKNGVAFARTSMAAFLLVCFATQVTTGFAAGSGGIETLTPKNGSTVFAPLGNSPIIALFINSPVHGQQNNFCNRQVQLSYRVDYGVCENQISYTRVIGRVAPGHIWAYDAPNTQWQTVHDRPYTSDICNAHVCFASNTFNGTIDLTNAVPQNTNEATLQLVAKWGKNIAVPDSSFDMNDTFIRLGWAHALNVHLQCEPQVGCIEILKETFDDQNNRTTPVPQFTFKLDNNRTTVNDGQGRAIFQNVTPGTHTVSEVVPNGWENFLVTPTNGQVQVQAGPNCAAVVFKNRQLPQFGCIEVLKEGFDANNNRITTPLPNFTFKLDNNQTVQSDAQGRALFQNVTPGQHVVTENPLAGWTNFNVTPANGTVNVTAGQNCAAVVFKNRQEPTVADLQIQKTGPTTIVRGTTAAYAIVVKNNGPAAATNVIVGDPVPAGTTFNAQQSDNRCQLQGNTVFCTLGTLAKDQQVSLSLAFDVPNANPQACQPGTLLNRASVLSDLQDQNLQDNESSFTSQVQCPQPQVGCIEILKEGYDANNNRITTALPGFTFRLGNQTVQSDAQGRATFQNVTPGTHTVTEDPLSGWTNFNVTPANGTVNVAAGPNCAGVVFKNRMDAQDADLQVQKTGPATAVRGSNLQYQIVAQNNGPAASPNTIVGDPLPAGTTFVAAQSDNRCTLSGNTVFCAIGTLNANQQTSLTVTLKTADPGNACQAGTVVNQASILGDRQDKNMQNNQSSFTTNLTCPASQFGCIEILKEGFDAMGGRLTTIPPFEFVLDGSGALNVHSDGQGRARFSNVPVGVHTVSEKTMTGWTPFNVTPANGTVNVTAGQNCAGVVFKNKRLPQNADVVVQKTGPATAVRGGSMTYSITVTNNGPATASGVVVDDVIPQGLENPVVNGQGCAINNGTVRCTIGSLAVGAQRVITVNVQVSAVGVCQTGTVTNTATATVQNDASTGNNTSSVTTQLQCPQPQQADLQIQKTGPASVIRGGNVTYQLAVKNNGPASATNVIVGDPLPAGTTFVAAQSDNRCTMTGNTVFCTLGTMTANQEITVQLTVNVTAPAPGQQCQTGTLVNQASVLSDIQDPNMQNNQSSHTTHIGCGQPSTADVAIVKSGPSAVQRGSTLSYNLVVSNAGPAAASGVTITDAVPAGLTLVSAGTGCTLTNGTITCAVGTLPAGQSRTYGFVFSTQAPSGSCTEGTVTNTALAATTTPDPVASNNQSSATTLLTCQAVQTGCIDVIKETYDTNNNVLTPVTQFTFTLDGTRTAVNDSLGRARFDNVPVGTHTVTETPQTNWTQVSVTPQDGSVNVTAGSCATVTFKNRQTLGGTTGWTITKTDHETEVEPGDTLEYEIRVRNLSAVRQTNVTVTDTLPDEVDFRDASPNESSENGRVIRWENQTFEPNEERVYRVEVEVDDDADGTLLNTAEVQGITATDRTDVEDDRDDVEIDLTKTASTSEVFPGGIIDYTVRIRNRGNDTIEDITVTDTLPADVIIIDDGDADSRSGRRLEWEIDELDEDDEEVFRYRVSVPTYMVAGQIIRNDVCVEADDVDEECESVTVNVLGIIPKTGATTSSAPNAHLKPIATDRGAPSDGSLPFLAAIALAGVGTGAGLGFGRRMLFGI